MFLAEWTELAVSVPNAYEKMQATVTEAVSVFVEYDFGLFGIPQFLRQSSVSRDFWDVGFIYLSQFATYTAKSLQIRTAKGIYKDRATF